MFSELEINNNVKIEDLYDNKTWVHGKNKNNIQITIFLITISSPQLKYSLEAINNLSLDIPFIVNCIKNINPTNKAYNEMRLRCKTKYFIQNDEDMELYHNSLITILNTINIHHNDKIFLYTFKLIDDKLGIGKPPIIDCLKVYNQEIMKKYPTFNNGKDDISSVDTLWHKNIILNGFVIKSTSTIIGYHGKHRTNFDILLRYCKILTSLIDPKIKTNSSHMCKFWRPLSKDKNINDSIKKILYLISKIKHINYDILNRIIQKLNMYIPKHKLVSYEINNRINIENITNDKLVFYEITNMVDIKEINDDILMAILAIGCVSTNSYKYSFDKYPYDIYNHFTKL